MFRWTYERAQMRLMCQGCAVTLRLRGRNPATPVDLYYGNQLVQQVQVGTAWQTVTVTLPDWQGVGVLELRTPTHVADTADPYPRGVMLGGVTLHR
ncbi:MAG: hypothetical protein HC893_06165 [Chloroflexaceae bacterium]|nr:hypothetical protein [Chloroflexaceae bacterium]